MTGAKCVAAFLLLATTSEMAVAAEILHTRLESGSGFIVVMDRLESGDEKKFNLIAQQYNKAAVLFSSPGGNLLAGIEIGRIIRMRNFGTGVAPGTMCASACAMAWLGGTKRYMDSASRVGFHAAYVVNNGIARETGLGNAIVGAYLTTLGLPLSAVVYITSTWPEDIRWLSIDDARQYGIDVEVLEPERPPSVSPGSSSLPSSTKLSDLHPLKAGEQWLVVASRANMPDAVEIAEKYKTEFPETMVVQAANGQYAVTLGKFVKDDAALDHLKQTGRIPSDSYFSKGAKLLSSVWH